jgi:hypothetical protein
VSHIEELMAEPAFEAWIAWHHTHSSVGAWPAAGGRFKVLLTIRKRGFC